MTPSETDKFIPQAVITPLEVEEHHSNGHAKPVIRGTWTRLYTSTVHILPIAITAVLLWLNHARIFWFPKTGPTPTNLIINITTDTIMNSLQLAAKLHEIFIIASLAAMTLKVFKRKLVGSGLPLGLVTGGYRVGDLGYLVSSPFLRNLDPSLLGGLLAVSTIVANIVGPASAILMLPGLDWYSLPGAFDKIITPIVYNRYTNQTWPSVVDGSIFNYPTGLDCSSWLASVYLYHCPAAGSVEISNWVAGWRGFSLVSNLTFQEPTSSIGRKLLLEASPWGVTFATTISTATMLSVGRFLNYIKFTDVGTVYETQQFKLSTVETSEIYQPLVQTQCAAYRRDELMYWQKKLNGTAAIFPSDMISCLGDETCQRMVKYMEGKAVSALNWNQTNYQPHFQYGFSAPQEDEETPLLLVLHVPYANQTAVGTWILGCTFMAHWVPATVTISSSESDMVESNITDFSVFDSPSGNGEVPGSRAIKLEDSWLPYLDPKENTTTTLANGTNTTTTSSFISRVLLPIVTTDTTKFDNKTTFFNPGDTDAPDKEVVEHFFQRVFGAILTEALSRTGSNASTFIVREKSQTKLVLADMAQQWGYGAYTEVYDWSSGSVKASYGNYTVPDSEVSSLAPEGLLAELDALVKYDFDVMRYGYGSGVPGPTLRFGFAVMYIYLAMLAIYAVVALCMRVRTVVAWGDLQDLLVLAWTSPAPVKLQGTGTGVDDKKAWLMKTKIKADSMGQTQLVVGDAQGMAKLDKGELYY